jgi:hypothetical protein
MKTMAEGGMQNPEGSQTASDGNSPLSRFIPPFSFRNPHSAFHIAHLVMILLVIVASLPGCAWTRWNQRGDLAFGPKVPCRVPPHATAEELVEYLNQNAAKLQAWRASRVRLRANNMPLMADIAVERDRHLRIVVTSVAGNELDLGSNDDVFWFWAKRNPEPAVMYAGHEQLELVRDTLQIPFEPDWLMEALGVATIPPEGTTLEPADNRTSRLVSHHTLPNGRTIRKTITVETCHGRVLEHSVWDEAGRRIAHATFSNHRLHAEAGVILAHHIQLEWPQADVSLAMDLGQVEINPTGLPERIWEMPRMPGYPLVNLEDMARHRDGGSRQGSRLTHQTPVLRRDRGELWQAHRETEGDEPSDLDSEASAESP